MAADEVSLPEYSIILQASLSIDPFVGFGKPAKALSSMDAPLIASGFDDWRRVGFAVIYPASRCGLVFAAGPDGIRGSTPSQSNELKARTLPRVWPIPVTLFRHHIIITLAIRAVPLCVMRRPERRSGTFHLG